MNEENKKKGLFERLFGSKKAKKGSCCGSFEIEELPEEIPENKPLKAVAADTNFKRS